ncbi:hypothetical protein VSH64_08285 [Amycolatopsis rhabdoformis]|uniref:Uncharacterized protein n=1 Tax=Amycolatopsis rhabdoformis TaxID=1448059 RepID=A0ABZ1IEY0_9PSEU|nr:hypothetical protein [Amycolatopsis rhabdoformis]WSE32104.1 hypothetical protein VSH64_08285 [Amycolatopsis rhabdoformis]
MRPWVRVLSGALGVVTLMVAGLVWWSADRALGPAPEIRSSTRGELTSCGYRPGLTSCDPPELATATVVVIVVLAAVGTGLAAVSLVGLVRRRSA